MKTAIATLKSASPYSQSKALIEKKTREETHEDFEKRIWHKRLHVTPEGNIFMPPMGFKLCLSDAAKYTSRKIPGERNATWTKHFKSGIMCAKPVVLPHTLDDIEEDWVLVPSDGKVGGSTKVWKCFGIVRDWEADVEFTILDDKIDKEIFETYLVEAGKYIGVGRWRTQVGGMNGRFAVNNIDWK